MQEPRRTRPTTAEDLWRLADLGDQCGLEVIQDVLGRYFVTSHSEPGRLHAVTGFTCDCRGWLSVGRCSHHSLLLRTLGWLPEIEPDLPYVEHSVLDCAECCGCGRQSFGSYDLPCESCGGSGVKPDRRLQGQPAVEVVAAA
jgi:hypothetical protein